MKFLVCFSACCLLVLSGRYLYADEPVSGRVAFINVNIVPMDSDRVIEAQTVLVENGIIARIADTGSILPADDVVKVDAGGKYLMPGLSEMHGHYPPPETSQAYTESILFLYVANGITLVRGMQGNEHHLPLRDAVERGEILGPRLFVSSPPLSGNSTRTTRDAEQAVRAAKQAGFDHIKVHEGLDPAVYATIARTAREIDIPFGGHVSNFVGLHEALRAGQSTIDHLDNYVEALAGDNDLVDREGLLTPLNIIPAVVETRIPDLVSATLRANAGVVPTMVLWENFFGAQTGAELRETTLGTEYMPREVVDNWSASIDNFRRSLSDQPAKRALIELRRRILKALSDGGARVLLGTDSPQIFSVPGFSIHAEMRVMVESGMTPYQVVHSGTKAVAEYYGAEDEFGLVAEGMRADLVLVDGNPLADVSNMARLSGVMVKGRWLSQEFIRNRLQAIADERTTN